MKTDLKLILPGGLVCCVRRPKPAVVAEETAPSRWERGWHVQSGLPAAHFSSTTTGEAPRTGEQRNPADVFSLFPGKVAGVKGNETPLSPRVSVQTVQQQNG